jgi:CheY-like chemotaxis protein
MINKLNCIMLVDDDEDDNFFHEEEIISHKFATTVIVQDSGKKALDYLRSKKDPTSDLIFLDINMPIMSGWDFLNEYNQLDKELQSKAMIIMLSTSENPTDIAKAKTWDFVSDYITKPLTREKMQVIVEKYFNNAAHS